MENRFNSFKDLKTLISSREDISELEEKEKTSNIPASTTKVQHLEAHFSNKRRGGKTVTIIKGFQGSDIEFKEFAKQIKQFCGVGGSIKNEEIIIQGNYRDKITSFLKNKGHKVKLVGG